MAVALRANHVVSYTDDIKTTRKTTSEKLKGLGTILTFNVIEQNKIKASKHNHY